MKLFKVKHFNCRKIMKNNLFSCYFLMHISYYVKILSYWYKAEINALYWFQNANFFYCSKIYYTRYNKSFTRYKVEKTIFKHYSEVHSYLRCIYGCFVAERFHTCQDEGTIDWWLYHKSFHWNWGQNWFYVLQQRFFSNWKEK